ncbi:ribonuclease H-like domain-containing protein [Tanacetum coccineum]|uniref:Ribonuclease H-like domain-containing protein n=1 Tax=Tanacetum coccineum TaxID=301880 RepID=A0ABQ4WEM2_9ASTR
MPPELTSDGIRIYVTTSERNRLKETLRRFGDAAIVGLQQEVLQLPRQETVSMHQPSEFWDYVHPDYVCLLQRSLYGLKQPPELGTDTAYLLLYVDDIVLTASFKSLLQQIIRSLHQEFAMTDLGVLNYFLVISVTRDSSWLLLSQKKYAIEILNRAHMDNCNPSRTPIDTESKLGSDGDPVFDSTLYRSLAGSLQISMSYISPETSPRHQSSFPESAYLVILTNSSRDLVLVVRSSLTIEYEIMVNDKKNNGASGSGSANGLPLRGAKLFVSFYVVLEKLFILKIYLLRIRLRINGQKNISRIYSVCKAFHRGEQQDLSLTAYVIKFKKMYKELNSLLPINTFARVIRNENLQSLYSSASNSALVSRGGSQGGYRNAKSKGSSARASATSDKTVTISSEEYARLKGSGNVNSSTSTAATAIAGIKSVELRPVLQVTPYFSELRPVLQVTPYFNELRPILQVAPYFSVLRPVLLQLFSCSTTNLVAYSDADWASCPTTHRSTSGYYIFLGNNLLSRFSKHQPTLSRSSVEAEYRGVTNVVAETCWLRNLLRELYTPLSSATLVYCDNVSSIYLSCNPVQHQRTKHIEIDIHFVHDLVVAGQVRVLHVPSRYQFIDIFTKGLPSALFEEFHSSLSVRCPPALTAGEC